MTTYRQLSVIALLLLLILAIGVGVSFGQQPPPPQQPQVVWVAQWTPGQRVWQWATGRPRTPLYQPYVQTQFGLQPVVGWVPAQQGGKP